MVSMSISLLGLHIDKMGCTDLIVSISWPWHIFWITLSVSLTACPLFCSICVAVSTTINLTELAFSNIFLVMKQLTRSIKLPPVSKKPARSPKTYLVWSSYSKSGRKVIDWDLEWPILNTSFCSLAAMTLRDFFFVLIVPSDFCISIVSEMVFTSRLSAPKTRELLRVLFPLPVSPIVRISCSNLLCFDSF